MTSIDDKIFLQVANELVAGIRDEALWTKAFALENGDEAKTKAHYIRLRVEALAAVQSPPIATKNFREGKPEPGPAKKGRINWLIAISVVLIALGILIQTQGRSKTPPPSEKTAIQEPQTAPSLQPASIPSDSELAASGIAVDRARQKIWISGELTQRTAKMFREVFSDKASFPIGKQSVVFIDSNGGDLYAAMEIGRLIRNHGNSAVVVVDDAKCYSSCIFVLAGGGQRIRRGSIGIHRPYLTQPSGTEQQIAAWFTKVSNDAKSYLREMRVRESLFDDMVSIPPSEIHIFSSTSEMDKYGLIKMDPVVEEQIAAVTMERAGIDRQEFMSRQSAAKNICKDGFVFEGRSYSYVECYEKIVFGEWAVK